MKKTCKICGKVFTPQNEKDKYCSPECREIAKENYNRIKKQKAEEKIAVSIEPPKPIKEQETVDKHCNHKNCVFRGTIQGSSCCNYILQKGTKRPDKISQCPGYRPVIVQLTMDNKIVAKFPSVKAAAEQFNGNYARISACLNKRLDSAYGYKWVRRIC